MYYILALLGWIEHPTTLCYHFFSCIHHLRQYWPLPVSEESRSSTHRWSNCRKAKFGGLVKNVFLFCLVFLVHRHTLTFKGLIKFSRNLNWNYWHAYFMQNQNRYVCILHISVKMALKKSTHNFIMPVLKTTSFPSETVNLNYTI